MKAYKIEVLVIDHEELGEQNVKDCLENEKYLSPSVMNIEVAEIGEWSDDHPLNCCNMQKAEFEKIFRKDMGYYCEVHGSIDGDEVTNDDKCDYCGRSAI